MNRAVQQDVVAVEIFPKSQWTCPSTLIMEDEGEKGEDGLDKEVKFVLQLFNPT